MQGSAQLFFLAIIAISTCAWADDTKPNKEWLGNGGLAFSDASGNTQTTSLTLTADATRQTADDKLSLSAQYVGSRDKSTVNGVTITSTTANQWFARSRYDHNMSDKTFRFGGLEFSHDQIQLLGLRSVFSVGLGYHMTKTTESQFDLLGGVSYRSDQYIDPGVTINNQLRTGFDTAELLLGEESSNKLSESTNFKQRLMFRPNTEQGFLVTFDSTLMVAINKTLSLRVSFQDRYNSLSQEPIKRNDTLFFTGINVKFGR
jgi:putative salt-induced outer membrane protein